MVARLTVLALGPAAVPGHLDWNTWRIVRSARVVGAAGAVWSQALEAAGVPVEPVDVRDPQGCLATVVHACEVATSVVWLDDGSPESSRVTQALATVEGVEPPEVVVVAGNVKGGALLELVRVMDRLRSPGGCPWDAEQTHASLLPFLLEESYEVVDAVHSGDPQHLREELGDLLLQVVFHARIAQEGAASVDVDDVARGIVDKLVRRHPHVFADVPAADADEVAARWDDLKRQEKSRTSVLDGIPVSQPALSLAQTFVRRARSAGLVEGSGGLAGSGVGAADVIDEQGLGEALLAVAVLAHERGWDAEQALRAAALRFAELIRAAERTAPAQEPSGGTP
jgi:XTP/dITP diphosphohydrolase